MLLKFFLGFILLASALTAAVVPVGSDATLRSLAAEPAALAVLGGCLLALSATVRRWTRVARPTPAPKPDAGTPRPALF